MLSGMESPLISVIVPVYKVEQYIARCLESLCAQTYRNLEIICVDDGSPDKSIDILNEFAERDARVRVIRRENGGLSAARNTGMEVARGEWLAFVDGDDWMEESAYAACVPHLTEEVDMLCFGLFFDNEVPKDDPGWAATEDLCRGGERHMRVEYDGVEDFSDAVVMNTSCNVCSKLFRRSVVAENGLTFPVGRWYEDASFYYRFCLLARRGYFLRHTLLYHYISRTGSIMYSSRRSSPKALDHLEVVRDVYAVMKERNLCEERRDLLASVTAAMLESAFEYAPGELRSELVNRSRRLVEEVGVDHRTEYDYIARVSRCRWRFLRLFYRRRGSKRSWGVFGLMLLSVQDKCGEKVMRILGIKIHSRKSV